MFTIFQEVPSWKNKKNERVILFSFRHSSLPAWWSGEKNITAAQVYFIEL